MKRTLLVVLAILCFSALTAVAQSYKLQFSADNSLSSCELASGGVGISTIHVLLTGSGGVTGLLFGAQIPSCWGGTTWIGDHPAIATIWPTSQENPVGDFWLAIGDTQAPIGLALAFRECHDLPLYIGTIEFIGVAPAPCCAFAPTHPSAWNNFATPAQVADCNMLEHEAAGGSVMVSSGPACPCQNALATEQSTWGRVKALYR